jgi:hypothetical protein
MSDAAFSSRPTVDPVLKTRMRGLARFAIPAGLPPAGVGLYLGWLAVADSGGLDRIDPVLVYLAAGLTAVGGWAIGIGVLAWGISRLPVSKSA